jgi:hypothetical protein
MAVELHPGPAAGVGMTEEPRNGGVGSIARPRGVTAAATLACVQSGITSVTTVLVLADALSSDDGQAALVLAGVVQVAGVALLIMGAARLMRGKSRSMVIVGFLLELVICLFHLIRFSASDVGGIGFLIGVPVFFAIMPVIGLTLLMSQRTGRSNRRSGARTAPAILAFVQAGSTLIVTGILMISLLLTEDVDGTAASANVATPLLATTAGDVETNAGAGELWGVSIAQLIGVGLLIAGGLRLVSGGRRVLLLFAAGLQVAVCAYWLIRGTDPLTPVLLVVMPLVALVRTDVGPRRAGH